MKKLIQAAVFSIIFAVANSAAAQVYKCTFVDKDSHQNKVIYTDAPCAMTSKQTLTDIQTASQLNAQNQQTIPVAQENSVDQAVTRAVLSRDFKLAKALATTKEHWRLIAVAEGEAPSNIEEAPQQQVAQNNECDLAKNDFESVSRTSWRDRDLVAAKKSIMYVACGVPESVQQPIYVAQGYGGIQSARWIAPYAYGWQRPYQHGDSNHHTNTGSNVSLSYRSKHVGLNVGSFGQQNSRYIQQTNSAW